MKRIIYLLLMTFLVSCVDHEYVRFETAQPDGVKETQSFKRKVKGEYVNCINSDDILIISDKMILNLRTYKFRSHRNDIEIDATISVNRNTDDELTELFESGGYDIEIVGDTIKVSQTDIDTIFQISENQKLKTKEI